MRKFYAFLLAGIFVFVIEQNILYAQAQEADRKKLSFINFIENSETNTPFSPIKSEHKPDILLTKAEAEKNSDLKTLELQQNQIDHITKSEEALQTETEAENKSQSAQDSKTEKNAENSLQQKELENSELSADENADSFITESGQTVKLPENIELQTDEQQLPARKKIGIDYPEDNDLVQKYLKQYTTDYAKKWLTAVMKNGAPYRGYIRAKIAEMGLPECLEFLPVIESNFKIDAVSKSGAMGMWQFMKNSISPFGIRINEWMDERYDPWITTDAALKKLKENYDMLGDWTLALAAYNSGLGAVSRACKKNPDADYWTLSKKKQLKNESINYVPKFLAISDILTNPEYYGIETIEFDETAHMDYTYVNVKRNVDISLLAEEVSIDSKLIKFLNPALFYGVTPPNTLYKLRIPSEYADAVTELVNNKEKLLIKYYLYNIRSGDTIYTLSRHYGVSEDMIKQANPGLKPTKLKIGQKILIPAFKEVDPYTGKSTDKKVAYTGSYKVQQGDSLWGLSLKYDVQPESLAEANNMDVNAILRIGSTLKVPIIE